MADRTLPELQAIFERALESGLEHGADALAKAMTETYALTEDQVREHLAEIYPKEGEFAAVLKFRDAPSINWMGTLNISGTPGFEIKRGHRMEIPQAFGGTMPSGHTGIFMRVQQFVRWRPKFAPRNVIPITSRRGRVRYVRRMKSGMYAGKYREPIFEFTGPRFSTLAGSKVMSEVFYAAAVQAMTEYFETQLK